MDTPAPLPRPWQRQERAGDSPVDSEATRELARQMQEVIAYTESCRRYAPEVDALASRLIEDAVELYRRAFALSSARQAPNVVGLPCARVI